MASPAAIIHFHTTPKWKGEKVPGKRVFVQWPGNRPGTDHQTYFQEGVYSVFEGKIQLITLGKNTVAIEKHASDLAHRFGANRFDRTGRTWNLNGLTYDIWERNPRD